jgi:hypothetical protein
VSGTAVEIATATLVFAFVICCTVSSALQLVAWWRHTLPDTPVTLRAVWKPEGYFDAVGLRQIRLARLLLLVGVSAYLTYLLLMLLLYAMR